VRESAGEFVQRRFGGDREISRGGGGRELSRGGEPPGDLDKRRQIRRLAGGSEGGGRRFLGGIQVWYSRWLQLRPLPQG
jgi:hypothetical protein